MGAHLHDHATAPRSRDPTHTTMVRRAFEADVRRRFRRIVRLVNEAVIARDVLGIGPATADAPGPGAALRSHQAIPPPPGAYQFLRSGAKVAAFMQWLEESVSLDVLGVRRGVSARVAAESAWSNVYIQSAYQRGIASATAEMRRQGVRVADSFVAESFTRPFHADRVGLAYTRTYGQLRGITEQMDQQISRVLALALAEGRGPQYTARQIRDRVERIGITRARTLARTETIAAHAEATLNTYEDAGVEGVRVSAELQTAGDDAVCPECEALEARTSSDPIPISEARGMVPVHPNCRCAWLPIVEDPARIGELR